ncbi:MAG TPA: hypothetical protein PKA19_04240, partial [Bacillota bacterium]|nr:hypothetical protein [Bacillota bacterium]
MKQLKWKDRSIGTKIMLPFVILMIIMVAAIDFSASYFVKDYFEQYIKENAMKNGEVISDEVETYKTRALNSLSWF